MPHTRLFIIGLVVVVLVVVSLVSWPRRRTGRRMRAVMQNRDLAAVSGLANRRVDATTFFIGSGLAGLAGVAVALIGAIGFQIGINYIIDAFLVVIVGGLGKLRGAVIAALALGLLNSFTEYWTSASIGKAIVFAARHPVPAVPPQRHRVVPLPGADDMSEQSSARPRTDGLRRDDRRCAGHAGAPHAAVVPRRPPAATRGSGRLSSSSRWPLLAVPGRRSSTTRPAPASGRSTSATPSIAVGIDIAWGYGGMLALGQGLFFGLGAYAMGMYLSLEQVGRGELPEFMSLYSD